MVANAESLSTKSKVMVGGRPWPAHPPSSTADVLGQAAAQSWQTIVSVRMSLVRIRSLNVPEASMMAERYLRFADEDRELAERDMGAGFDTLPAD